METIYVGSENYITLRSPLIPVAQLSLVFIFNSISTHRFLTPSREVIAAYRLLTLTAMHLSWPRTTNCDKTHAHSNPLFAPKCKPSPLVSKQGTHFPRPQPQIPTNGSKINIFIIQILPVDNIWAFKNYTLIGYDWDDDELLSVYVPRNPSRNWKSVSLCVNCTKRMN
jgi:hypothetical protein